MKKILFLCVFIIAFSCSKKKETTKIVEISCGQCQFSLSNKGGCDLAVRIDNNAYFVDGFDIDAFGDAHNAATGFCEVIRKATVSGIVKNGRFKASAIKLVDALE